MKPLVLFKYPVSFKLSQRSTKFQKQVFNVRAKDEGMKRYSLQKALMLVATTSKKKTGMLELLGIIIQHKESLVHC